MGGFKVQGKELDAARALLDDAKALAAAGCFAVVLEGIPTELARLVTERIDIPTIGIGAGVACDGQVLVWHDVVGFGGGEYAVAPKFVRRYADLRAVAVEAISAFAADVRRHDFPSDQESYHLRAEVADALL
jgi:3-methyl-2-oxobutanoate hydroxymethyltransferase